MNESTNMWVKGARHKKVTLHDSISVQFKNTQAKLIYGDRGQKRLPWQQMGDS